MKKKLITIVIGAMLCAGLFAGCGQSDSKQDKAKQAPKMQSRLRPKTKVKRAHRKRRSLQEQSMT